MEPQANGVVIDFGNFILSENTASQNQINEKKNAERITKEVDKVMAVENRLHDAILTVMVDVAIVRGEIGVRSITESSGVGGIEQYGSAP